MVAIYRLMVGIEYGKISAPLVFLLQTLPGSFHSHTNQTVILRSNVSTMIQWPVLVNPFREAKWLVVEGSHLVDGIYCKCQLFHHLQ